jgi:hypothetical protein
LKEAIRSKSAYTFERLVGFVEGLLNQISFTQFGLYVQDYGGPIGFRIINDKYGVSNKAIICMWKNDQLMSAICSVGREHELVEKLKEWLKHG